ncbi:MAG: amino acid ABC transporter permease [Actinocatenispora sp.]
MALAESANPLVGGLQFLWQERDAFLDGFLGTIKLSVVAGILATVVGLIVAAMRVSPIPALRVAGTAWSSFFRNTPLTLVFLGTSVILPVVGIRFTWAEDAGVDTFFVFAVIALSTYTSCFVADAVRSGFNAVPVGQAEAARAVGMTFGQTLRLVVFPQALRTVLPPLASMYIAMIKNSAIAEFFSVGELTKFFDDSVRDHPIHLYAEFLAVAIGYIVLTLLVSGAFNFAERRLAVAR